MIGLTLELGVIVYQNNFPGLWEFVREKLTLILGVVAAYVLISSYLVYKETNRQVERSQLTDLELVLPNAKSLFATCALSLKDWFDPSTLVYFSKLLGRKLESQDFCHQRVLLFFHEGQLKDSQSLFIDGHWANAMVAIHETFDIDLAFLTRKNINAILATLTTEEKRLLGFYPRWLKNAPEFLLQLSLRMRRTIPEMDFAFITHEGAAPTVLPFSRRGESLKVDKESSVLAYEKLMNAIKTTIYEPNVFPPRVRSKFEFSNKIKQI
jgi:hypothetical protein